MPKDTARFKFLQKLGFSMILYDFHVYYSKSSFKRNSKNCIQKEDLKFY